MWSYDDSERTNLYLSSRWNQLNQLWAQHQASWNLGAWGYKQDHPQYKYIKDDARHFISSTPYPEAAKGKMCPTCQLFRCQIKSTEPIKLFYNTEVKSRDALAHDKGIKLFLKMGSGWSRLRVQFPETSTENLTLWLKNLLPIKLMRWFCCCCVSRVCYGYGQPNM